MKASARERATLSERRFPASAPEWAPPTPSRASSLRSRDDSPVPRGVPRGRRARNLKNNNFD